MNIKKIDKQLKKINQLFENIKEDGIISPIERDLMLSYVRNLYEKMLESDQSPSEKAPKTGFIKSTPAVEEEIVPEPKMNPIADAVLQEVSEDNPRIEPKQEFTPPVVEEEKTPPPSPKIEIPEELSQLFTLESTKELSDKLSRSPIADLTKSMGINEKIFTVQELFGGDSTLFTQTMESLDKMTSLDQAKDYLVENVAIKQNWTAEGKLKKAAHFIKLISRRY